MEDWIEEYLKRNNFDGLLKTQEGVIERGLLNGERMFLISPTSSGKTFLADMLISLNLDRLTKENRPIIYVIPYVAAARQRAASLFKNNKVNIVSAAKRIGQVAGIDSEIIKYKYTSSPNETLDSFFLKLGYSKSRLLGNFEREEFWRLIFLEYIKLFSIKSKFKNDFNDDKILYELRKSFKDAGRLLSSNAKISTVSNTEWNISDGEKEYKIKEFKNQLYVYQERELNKLSLLQYLELICEFKKGRQFINSISALDSQFRNFIREKPSEYYSVCKAFIEFLKKDNSDRMANELRAVLLENIDDFLKTIRSLMKYGKVSDVMLDDELLDNIKLREKLLLVKNPEKLHSNLKALLPKETDFLIEDIDFTDPLLTGDVLVTTPELLDKYLRRHDWFFENAKLLILDEIHVLGDEKRGGVLDKVISWIRELTNDDIHIFALSATIKNEKEVADWLKVADNSLIVSKDRPVDLIEGVVSLKSGEVIWNDPRGFEFIKDIKNLKWRFKKENTIFHLCDFMRKQKGQTMVFTRGRDRCEYLAKKYARKISYETGQNLEIYRNEDCWKVGVGFHNGSLNLDERAIVESKLGLREIHTIFCTSTLAIGLNIPARLVIVETHEMPREGILLKKTMAKQMVGRAGRYKFDHMGYALYLAKDDKESGFIYDNFIEGEIEETKSELNRNFSTHVLSLMNNGREYSFIKNVIENTFYVKDAVNIKKELDLCIETLLNEKLCVKDGSRYVLTESGKAMVKYFIDVDLGISMLRRFNHVLDQISEDLQEKTPSFLEDAENKHLTISISYNSVVDVLSNSLSKAADEISSNRLTSEDLGAFLRLQAYGEVSVYKDLKLKSRDREALFNNLGRYISFLKESTDSSAFINFFEKGIKTSTPYAYQWLIGGKGYFSYKNSIKLTRKIRENEHVNKLFENPYLLGERLQIEECKVGSKSEPRKFVTDYTQVVQRSTLNEKEKKFFEDLDPIKRRYIIDKIEEIDELNEKEEELIEALQEKP